MKYYKCIDIDYSWQNYLTIGKIYKESNRGNYKDTDTSYTTIENLNKNLGVNAKKYLEEVTKLEYLRSINLKEKLIKLANSNKYAIKLESIEDVIKLDKLFFQLEHFLYNKFHNKLSDWYSSGGRDNICFNLHRINFGTESSGYEIITIKQLLDYV